VQVSHNIGCKVVAEGIETQDQLDCVKSSGADIGQGFLFAAPWKKIQSTTNMQPKLCSTLPL
jgi:EAL domain-containing protein (putative c-di-GMP-specific phosphodiesterase class I)